jgi:hypothetical protein
VGLWEDKKNHDQGEGRTLRTPHLKDPSRVFLVVGQFYQRDNGSSVAVSTFDGVGFLRERGKNMKLASNGITWPWGSPDKSDWDNNTAGGKLLEELQKDYPDRKFKLDRGAACGVQEH